MKQTPNLLQIMLVALAAFALLLAIGCSSSTPTGGISPQAVFTAAVETAYARQTSTYLTQIPTMLAATQTAAIENLTPTPSFDDSGPSPDQATQSAAIATQASLLLPTSDGSQPATQVPPVEINPAAPPAVTNTPGAEVTAPAPGSETACIPNTPPQKGKVLDVVDGDTIKVMIDGKTYTVRYLGIDAPAYLNKQAPFSMEARLKNAELVFAKDISLYGDTTDLDDSGRLLRYVKVGDTFVNWEMVALGWAVAAPNGNPACDATFKTAQDMATANQVGMWVKP